jgi:hypothetical protein
VHFVAVADDLEAVAILDNDLLANDTVFDGVHYLEGIDLGAAHPHHGTRVIRNLHGTRHAIQPFLR